jgi:hypothetical protein
MLKRRLFWNQPSSHRLPHPPKKVKAHLMLKMKIIPTG